MPDEDQLELGEVFVLLTKGPLVYKVENFLPKNRIYISYADVMLIEDSKRELVIVRKDVRILRAGPGYKIAFGISWPMRDYYVLSEECWADYETENRRIGVSTHKDSAIIWRIPINSEGK